VDGDEAVDLMPGLDPRVKLCVAVGVAVWVGLVPVGREPVIAVVGVAMVVAGAWSRVPPTTLLRRAAGALPFILFPAAIRLFSGLDLARLAGMAVRGYTTALDAALLVSVTPFTTLLAAASALGVPDLLVQTIALIYRYLQVLRDRGSAMADGARARGYGPSSPDRFAIAGNMLGALLIRSLHRADRVHQAMLARGYTGRLPAAAEMRLGPADGVVLVASGGAIVGSLLWMR
jgi:cobalt/nickel transport system permease protein